MSRPIKYNKQLKPIDNVIAIADTGIHLLMHLLTH